MAKNRSKVPSVTAQFRDAAQVVTFLQRLGMPGSLLSQLQDWVHHLSSGTAEQMDPELMWDRKPARLSMLGQSDDEGHIRIEFAGPATLIRSLQDELDSFFKKPSK